MLSLRAGASVLTSPGAVVERAGMRGGMRAQGLIRPQADPPGAPKNPKILKVLGVAPIDRTRSPALTAGLGRALGARATPAVTSPSAKNIIFRRFWGAVNKLFTAYRNR